MDRLYTSDDLLAGYDRTKPNTFVTSWDYQQYAAYVAAGGASPKGEDDAIIQAKHDAGISRALDAFKSMIFVDPADYWTTDPTYGPDGRPTSPSVNIRPTIEAIFKMAGDTSRQAMAAQKVAFTTDFSTIRDTLNGISNSSAGRLWLEPHHTQPQRV